MSKAFNSFMNGNIILLLLCITSYRSNAAPMLTQLQIPFVTPSTPQNHHQMPPANTAGNVPIAQPLQLQSPQAALAIPLQCTSPQHSLLSSWSSPQKMHGTIPTMMSSSESSFYFPTAMHAQYHQAIPTSHSSINSPQLSQFRYFPPQTASTRVTQTTQSTVAQQIIQNPQSVVPAGSANKAPLTTHPQKEPMAAQFADPMPSLLKAQPLRIPANVPNCINVAHNPSFPCKITQLVKNVKDDTMTNLERIFIRADNKNRTGSHGTVYRVHEINQVMPDGRANVDTSKSYMMKFARNPKYSIWKNTFSERWITETMNDQITTNDFHSYL